MNCSTIDPRARASELENYGTIFEHDKLAIQNGKGEGGKARKPKSCAYRKSTKTLIRVAIVN
jgi:hypothetical protein